MSTDPITLAREVLDSAKYAESRFMSISDMPSIGRAAPDLARAVLRAADLADQLEMEGTQGVQAPNRTPHDSGWHDSQIIAATRIRAALNGGDA